jgi:hypothetical protein
MNSNLTFKFDQNTAHKLTGDDFRCKAPYGKGLWGGYSSYPEDTPSDDGTYPSGTRSDEAWNRNHIIRPNFATSPPDPEVFAAFFGTSGAGATSLQGKHKPGWCRNWLELI